MNDLVVRNNAYQEMFLELPEKKITKKVIVDFQESLVKWMEENNFPNIAGELPIENIFNPGLYTRSIFIPAGTVVVGRCHAHEHLSMIIQGTVAVADEFNGVCLYEAPYHFTSLVGTKRLVYAVTDVLWSTFHPGEYTGNETEDELIERITIPEDKYMELTKQEELLRITNEAL